MEIERKWLTFGWPEGLKAAAVIRMEQGYIATRPTVRIRLEERGEQVRRVLCFKGKAGPDGLAREEIETDVTPELERLMEGRQIYQHKAGEAHIPLCAAPGRFSLDTAAPILSEGDVLGCVVFAAPEGAPEGGEVEYKLAQSAAAFLGRHMEG